MKRKALTSVRVGDQVALLDDTEVPSDVSFEFQYYPNSGLDFKVDRLIVSAVEVVDGRVMISIEGDFRLLDAKRFYTLLPNFEPRHRHWVRQATKWLRAQRDATPPHSLWSAADILAQRLEDDARDPQSQYFK